MRIKEFKSTVQITARRGVTHGVRNRQREYVSRLRADMTVVETYCGRHHPLENGRTKKGPVTCDTCVRGIRAAKAA